MTKHRAFHAAAGAFVLAAAVLVPSGPALADGVRDQQWYLDSLKISQAHAVSTGAGVTVGLVDSGVSPHPDLKRNLLTGIDEATGKAGAESDKIGHGTQMAGLIAAHGRGSAGLLGIAPAAKILPVKISGTAKAVPPDLVAKGIEYSISHKARVINISAETAPSFDLVDALQHAATADVVVVAASGNIGGTALAFPASADGVLAVGSTGRSGKHSEFATSGAQVQLCAPGEQIETVAPGDKYVSGTGTSESAAIVSGAVALVRAKFPQLSAAEVVHRITATADDIGPAGRDDQCGYGELNIVKALTADVPPLGGASTSASPAPSTASAAGPVGTTGAAASASDDDQGSSTPLVIGVVVVVLLIAALVGVRAVRRQRR